MKFYIAYGSNLSHAQMRERCPDAVPYGAGVLKDYELVFKVHADIVPHKGWEVPIGVWTISDKDEEFLDYYEGYPGYYIKKNVDVTVRSFKTGELRTKTGMVYMMAADKALTTPDRYYFDGICEGYHDFNLDIIPLLEAFEKTHYAHYERMYNERWNVK